MIAESQFDKNNLLDKKREKWQNMQKMLIQGSVA